MSWLTTWFVYVVDVEVVVADPSPPYKGTFAHTVTGTLPVSRFVDVESSVAPSGFPGPLRVACMIPMFATKGSVPLEESVAIYERGEALKQRCEELLRQAEARVEKITLDAAGKPTGTEPLDGG